MVRALLKTYRHLKDCISETNALVDELYGKMPYARLNQTVPGFGKFLSMLVSVEIEDIKRFDYVRKLHAYTKVIPSTHSSGERSYYGKITKEGNRWLRCAAVQAVWPSL
jgi:transposase